ncbi:MAG: ATP-dependent helicase, partial [Rhizobiaceae bacterium]|nr:ATP-dependent helicase [Rhizobiaceae bacterium]
SGTAITLCAPDENAKLRQVEKIIRMKLPVIADHLDQPDPVAQPRQDQRAEDAAPREHHRAGRPGGEGRPRHGAAKKPFAGKPEGDRPSANKPKGDKPFGSRGRSFKPRRPARAA